MEGSRVDGPHPRAARSSCELPLPGLYNVYNALGRDRRRACGSGSTPSGSPRRWARCAAAFGRVETIEVGGRRGLDPADQEPGRRQRGPAHAAAGGRERSRSTSGSRSTTGSPTAATSPGSGTPTSSCSRGAVRRVTCAGTRAPEMALRLKYAGWPDGADRGRARRSRPRSTRAVAAAAGPPLRPPHLHRAARAAQAARRPRPGEGVLAMSATRPSAAAIWHDVECGAYAADLRSGRSWPTAAGGPVLDLGCGTGRVALHLARRGHQVIGLDLDPELIAALARARRRASRSTPVARRRPRLRARPSRSPWRWRRCSCCSCSPTAPSALACLRLRRRASCAPGGRFAAAIVEGMPEPDEGAAAAARRARGRRLGLLEPAARGRRRRRARSSSAACARRVSPAGELTEEPDEVTICTPDRRRSSRPRRAEAGLVAGRTPSTIAAHRRSTSARPSSSSARRR